jgi:hypothetical protein
MNAYRPKVYGASKIHHAKLWRTLRNDPEWDFVDWTANWIDHPDLEEGQDPIWPSDETFRAAWIANINDVKIADFLLLYAGGEAGLKGALIECGAAIGLGIPVIAVRIDTMHSWANHPGVIRVPTLVEARTYLYRFTTMVPPTRRKKGRPYDES